MADGAHQEKPINLFYSYSHRDEELRKKLEDHLAALRWSGMIAEWHDRNIEVGDEWAKEIDRNLSSADIILLLVSSSFIASEYCWSIEMKKALERHNKGEAKVIPVILRPCGWHRTPFAKLQAAPKDATPVTSWSDQDAALCDVAGKIERAVTDLQQRRRRAAEQAEEKRLRVEAETKRKAEEERQREEAQRKANEEERLRRQQEETEAKQRLHQIWDKGQIFDYLVDEFSREQGIDLRNDRVALQRLKEAAKKAKVELSSTVQTEVNLPFAMYDGKRFFPRPKHLNITLTRTKLEALEKTESEAKPENPTKEAQEPRAEKLIGPKGRPTLPILKWIKKRASPDPEVVATMTYAQAFDYFVAHRPADSLVVKGAMLLQEHSQGRLLIQVFLDRNSDLVCDTNRKPYGRRLVVRSFDIELQEAFGGKDLVIVEFTAVASAGNAASPTIFRDADAPWCPKMVVIPEGEFLMGSPLGERGRYPDEGPQHQVRIGNRFAIGRYPVTFTEYDYFCEVTGCERPKDEGWGRAQRPVINISWWDAVAYCAWLTNETGQPYRLPSEAEWEYAARAGTTTRYAFGDVIGKQNANYYSLGKTTDVGAYPPNPWLLYDMHGNVWEWVEDIWHDSYEGAPADGAAWTHVKRRDDIILPGTRNVRQQIIYSVCMMSLFCVLRGGSWFSSPWFLRSAVRNWIHPFTRDSDIGFRIARTLDLRDALSVKRFPYDAFRLSNGLIARGSVSSAA